MSPPPNASRAIPSSVAVIESKPKPIYFGAEIQRGVMDRGRPSRTAFGAAAFRAAHQIVDQGNIFNDPYALAILGERAAAAIEEIAAVSSNQVMRLFIATRSRVAEDCLSAAVARGVRQAVILGAGLDTFSLRNPHSELGLRVFEVDHPSTQQWKRRHLEALGLNIAPSVAFAPVDFERQTLTDGLAAAGFRCDRPAFFIWLGVVPYLRRETVSTTLQTIAGMPMAEVVFDYSEPLENYSPARRPIVTARAADAASAGEPWLSFFDPRELQMELLEMKFEDIEDLGLPELAARYFSDLALEANDGPGPHLIRARRLD